MTHELPIYDNKPTSCGFWYEFACCIDECGAVVRQTWNGSALIGAGYPGDGWKNFGAANWVCPKHKISIVIDGKDCPEAFGWQLEPLTTKFNPRSLVACEIVQGAL
jgi:hypothetical protein